jgi:hypothetical protein
VLVMSAAVMVVTAMLAVVTLVRVSAIVARLLPPVRDCVLFAAVSCGTPQILALVILHCACSSSS